MRLGVISDTHRKLLLADAALEQMGEIDYLLHAGDHYDDALTLAVGRNLRCKAVVGNCDFFTSGPEEEILELEEAAYNPWTPLSGETVIKVIRPAEALKCRLSPLGIPISRMEKEKGIILLNPGSIGAPRGGTEATFGILEINRGIVRAHIYPVKKESLDLFLTRKEKSNF